MKKKQEKIGKYYICPMCKQPVTSKWEAFGYRWNPDIPTGFFGFETHYPEWRNFRMHSVCHEKLLAQVKREIEMRKRGIFVELLEWKCEYCGSVNNSKSAPNFCNNCGAPRKKTL